MPANKDAGAVNTPPDPFFTPSSHRPAGFLARLPDWTKRFSATDLQSLLKASVAVWIATIFIFIEPVLAAFGQATFFAAITLFFLPCNGIVFIQLLGGVTMLIGMGLAWAWGTITSKAALAARPAAETNARLALLAQTAQQQAPNTYQASGQTAYTQILIFEGFMLDTRVTVTFFGMILPFIYLMARLRAKTPKAALIAVFAWIISDIYLTTAPLIPSFQGTIPQTILKPAAAGIGLGVVCNIFIFPKSTSFVAFEAMLKVLQPMTGFHRAQADNLRHPDNEFNDAYLSKLQLRVFEAYQDLQSSLSFLALDTAIGRWSPADTRSLSTDLRPVVMAFSDQIRFTRHRQESKHRMQANASKSDSETDEEKSAKYSQYSQEHLADAFIQLREGLQGDEAQTVLRKSLQGLLSAGAADLLESCEDANTAILDAIRNVNYRRVWRTLSVEQCAELSKSHGEVLERLAHLRGQFEKNCAHLLVNPHDELFDTSGRLRLDTKTTQPAMLGVFLGLVLCERFLHTSGVLHKMLSTVVELEQTRIKSRLWLPGRLDLLVSWMFSSDSVPGMTSTESPVYADEDDLTRQRTNVTLAEKEAEKAAESGRSHKKQAGKKSKKDKNPAQTHLNEIRQQGQRKHNPVAAALIGLNQWLFNDEGLFALRVVIVSLALAVPAVTMSSAGFYYREKGLWALIMAQTGLVVYTADFVHAVVIRVSGTVLGGVIGMACWYIGAGSGPGNPYGMAAIMVPVILIFMYMRLFAPMEMLQATILMAATIYLVVAYSWVDTHIPSYGNPGVGYNVFWRRMLLVIIGFSASMIVLLFPKPPSGSRRYRQQMAGTLSSVLDLYVFWKEEASDEDLPKTEAFDGLKEICSQEVLQNLELLVSLASPIELLHLEISSTGFDAASMASIRKLCIEINLALVTLLHVFASSPQEMDQRFLRRSGALEKDVMGDLMAVLTLSMHSIKTGDAIPSVLPGPLLVKFATDAYGKRAAEDAGSGYLTRDVVVEDGFRRYCVMLTAFVQLLGACDELVGVIKQAVGESHVLAV